MRLGLLISLALVIAVGTPLETQAGGLQPCLADFIRPDTSLEVQLSTIKPQPECPRKMQIDRVKQQALMLKAAGKFMPTLGAADPRGDDNSKKAPLLFLTVLRFDRSVYEPGLLDFWKAQFDQLSITDLDFERELSGNPTIRTRGFLVRDVEPGRNLLCLSAVDDPTVTLAIVCRSTTHESKSDQIGMLERMSQDDLTAIRF